MTPLEGLLVADLSRVLAGPLVEQTLGDLGADVIKVERPDGDDTRTWAAGRRGGDATYFQAVNRNKRSVVLDLADAGDLGLGAAAGARADVVVENFRPGMLERLGLGYEQRRCGEPGLVYCSITGFGGRPGRATLPGYDLLVQAVGGLMSITGAAEGEPRRSGVALVDVIAGLYAAVGILAALDERRASGEGQRVEVDLLPALLAGARQPGVGLHARRRRAAAAWATATRASRRTRVLRSAPAS